MVVEIEDPAIQSKFKIKVDGQEVEVTQDELIELAQKGKDYTQNMQKLGKDRETLNAEATRVAGLKAIVDEMEADPKLKETLNKVYSDFKSGKISKSDDNKDRNLKLLDKRIEEATDSETREQLRDIRAIIQQEAPDVEKIKEDLRKEFRTELDIIKNTALISQTDRVETQLKKIEEKFGADLVNKYKKDIMATAIKFPNQSVNKLLYHFADDSEIETALLNQAKKKEKEELERKKRGSSPSGTETSFTAKTELKKDRAGRVTFESLKDRILERLGKK